MSKKHKLLKMNQQLFTSGLMTSPTSASHSDTLGLSDMNRIKHSMLRYKILPTIYKHTESSVMHTNPVC